MKRASCMAFAMTWKPLAAFEGSQRSVNGASNIASRRLRKMPDKQWRLNTNLGGRIMDSGSSFETYEKIDEIFKFLNTRSGSLAIAAFESNGNHVSDFARGLKEFQKHLLNDPDFFSV